MKILVKELEIGMCIGEDVYTDNAMLVVANHTIITDSIISRLELFRIKEVEIIDIELDKEAFTFDVTKTQEFLVFKENSTNLKDSLSNSFNGILTKNPDPDEVRTVLDLGKRLFDENKGNSNILDILHNMQAFSDTTYMHCVNVGIIAALIGTWLEWPENEVQLLVECGLFHDIGKLATPPEILNKPGKLTNEEYEIMKQHTSE